MKERRDKINYYLDISETVSERSTCLRRQWGAIIVRNNSIMSSGYNGSPAGMFSCIDSGICNRQNSQRGTDYSNCPAVHAEANAILQAGKERTLGSDLYLVGLQNGKYTEDPNSCTACRRLIINAGIEKVFIRIDRDNYKQINVKEEWASVLGNILGGY